MAEVGNRAVEAAEAAVGLERDAAIAAIRNGLARAGSDSCGDCGEPISAARRRVLPSAQRCADCESRRERRARRGW